MEKPTILLIDETKKELFTIVNNAIQSGVPCYFLEPILTNILGQIQVGAKTELEKAKEMYKKEETKDENNSMGSSN